MKSNLLSSTAVHHVRLTKTGDKGTIVDHPVFEGYTVLGHTVTGLPVVGERFRVLRYDRNGVEVLGVMSTSPVERTAWSPAHVQPMHLTFETANSTYRLDFLADVEPSA